MNLLTQWHDSTLAYDGTQLRSHFPREMGIGGADSLVAFIGPCQVSIEHLVDAEDAEAGAHIFSHSMLHFIGEFFSLGLPHAICWQRLSMAIIADEIRDRTGAALVRSGDDLYQDQRKLSVSIATATPVSSLIHIGLNLDSSDTPVPAISLPELGILDASVMGQALLERMAQEYSSMWAARTKVRALL